MSENRINQIIGLIGKQLEGTVSDMTVQQGETGPVLSVTMPSPYENGKAVGYTISIFDGGNGFLYYRKHRSERENNRRGTIKVSLCLR